MKKKKRIVYNLCLAVLICIFLGSAGYLAYYFLQSKKSEDQFQELEAMIDAPVNEEEIVYVATDGDAEPGLEFVNIDGQPADKIMILPIEGSKRFLDASSIDIHKF